MEASSSSPSSSSSVTVATGDRFRLHDRLELLEFADKYVVKSFESPNRGFSISREDGDIQPLDGADVDPPVRPYRTSTIYGVAGTIRLVAVSALQRGTEIFHFRRSKNLVHDTPFQLSYSSADNAVLQLGSLQKRDEAYFMNLLRIVESTPGLYYSYDTDITLNLQRRCKLTDGWMAKPIWKQADPRFVWNRNLLEDLIEAKCYHVGTRMWRRGANLQGDTANSIETEQLLETEGFRSSFLQFRGSVPLLWEQIVDLSYKPRLRIIDNEQTPKVVERHFLDLSQRYGDVVAVDLTDKHGDEGLLSAAYANEMKTLPSVRYCSFDFHHFCSNSNFDKLQILYDQVSEDFEKQGYFLVDDADGEILEEQKGIIRSNCIDCLDRTNVTQSFLAQKSLTIQLRRVGVLGPDESFTNFNKEYGKFRTLWAEQGDEISLGYAGTHALKGDLVRYGKQTLGGMIKDGMSALSRYYLNNFQDGYGWIWEAFGYRNLTPTYFVLLQDALDLISGRYSVSRQSPSPFRLNGFESLSSELPQYLPVASALLIGGLTVTSFTLQQAGRNAQQYLSTVLWAGVTAGVMAAVKANGRQFCSRPRLCGLL
ncbi:unnamed protein product [Linum tenue]|uniref:SAC domain-containing protein n=1 Tax=Linum tenue TaxID=586396 RepID=A0AAV0KXW3_9ROSI|nr:unnamed protein product [Linum tenue]